jgi:hypothetical protein
MSDVEFESPHPTAASPPGSAHEAVVTEDGPHQQSSWEPSPPGGQRGLLAAVP